MADIDADLSLYADVLEQIRRRGDAAREFLSPPISYPRVESAALQVRFMLELIPLGSLIAHLDLVAQVASAYSRKKPDEAAKLVKQVNPDYWPKPIVHIGTPEGEPDRWEDVTEPFVAEGEWQAEWGYLSSLLHARNPFSPLPDLNEAHGRVAGIYRRLVVLINLHQIRLPDAGVLVIGQILSDDGHAHAYQFQAIRETADDTD